MASLNRVEIIGNLGADPELRYTPNGVAVTELRVATNQNRKVEPGTGDNGGEWISEATWFRVKLWAEQAERAAEQLRKGKQIYVDGRIRTFEYDKDGQRHYGWEVIANRFMLLGRREDDEGRGRGGDAYIDGLAGSRREPVAAGAPARNDAQLDVDDIPF